jgi:hypothetical protein
MDAPGKPNTGNKPFYCGSELEKKKVAERMQKEPPGMLPVAVHLPFVGLYSSAVLLRATSAWPLCSKVPVWPQRPAVISDCRPGGHDLECSEPIEPLRHAQVLLF